MLIIFCYQFLLNTTRNKSTLGNYYITRKLNTKLTSKESKNNNSAGNGNFFCRRHCCAGSDAVSQIFCSKLVCSHKNISFRSGRC